jgi:di- and tripeptidase
MNQHNLKEIATLESSSDAVLALASRDNTLFAGHQAGVIKVGFPPHITESCYVLTLLDPGSQIWDLDTLTCIRTLHPHSLDILSLTVLGDHLYSGASNGTIQRWDRSFQLVHEWQAHDNIVLSSEASFTLGKHLLTGGSDASLKVWDIRDEDQSIEREPLQHGFQGLSLSLSTTEKRDRD